MLCKKKRLRIIRYIITISNMTRHWHVAYYSRFFYCRSIWWWWHSMMIMALLLTTTTTTTATFTATKTTSSTTERYDTTNRYVIAFFINYIIIRHPAFCFDNSDLFLHCWVDSIPSKSKSIHDDFDNDHQNYRYLEQLHTQLVMDRSVFLIIRWSQSHCVQWLQYYTRY